MRQLVTLAALVTAILVAGCRAPRGVSTTPAPQSDRVLLLERADVLYVLDGRVLQDADSTGVPSAVRQLDPRMIESIEVLKGSSARRAYGDAGASGVVIIRTKSGR